MDHCGESSASTAMTLGLCAAGLDLGRCGAEIATWGNGELSNLPKLMSDDLHISAPVRINAPPNIRSLRTLLMAEVESCRHSVPHALPFGRFSLALRLRVLNSEKLDGTKLIEGDHCAGAMTSGRDILYYAHESVLHTKEVG